MLNVIPSPPPNTHISFILIDHIMWSDGTSGEKKAKQTLLSLNRLQTHVSLLYQLIHRFKLPILNWIIHQDKQPQWHHQICKIILINTSRIFCWYLLYIYHLQWKYWPLFILQFQAPNLWYKQENKICFLNGRRSSKLFLNYYMPN